MASEAVIVVDQVWKRFRIYHERNQYLKASILRGRRARYEEFWALRDVSLEVREGEVFAIIGENGSGKSTLLKCLTRILTPEKGRIEVKRRMSALLELGSGFHPELSGRENVYLNGAILGMSRREIDLRFDEIVQFSGLERFIDTPVKNYSSGMYVRLGFAVAINVNPDILIVDEVLAVGDAVFQQRCYEKFAELRNAGKTLVVVTHDLGSVRTMADRAVWLSYGELKSEGTAGEVTSTYSDETLGQRAGGDRRARAPAFGYRRDQDHQGHAARPGRPADTARPHGRRRHDPLRVRRPGTRPPARVRSGRAPPERTDAVRSEHPRHRRRPGSRLRHGRRGHRHRRLAAATGLVRHQRRVWDFPLLHAYDQRNRVTRFDVLPGDRSESYGMLTLRPELADRARTRRPRRPCYPCGTSTSATRRRR